MKKLLITLLKIGVSAAIIAYLVWKSTRGDVFTNLCEQPKDWPMLAGACGCCIAGTLLTFIRWWYLVVALDVPLRFGDAMRISTWGYLFNLAPLGGIVGGDVVKAVMLGHEHPQHRAKALASVLVDRVVGLYLLFVVASAAMVITGFWNIPEAEIWWIATFVATFVGTVGLGVVLGPDLSKGVGIRAIGRIPKIGHFLEKVILAVRLYSQKPVVLILSSAMSIGVHCSFACACYLIARGLPGGALPFGMYFVIMPLSAAGVLPLSMGPLEWVLYTLYPIVPVASGGASIVAGQGLVVALAYRVITILMAVLGLPYYFGNRRELKEVIHEVEEESAEENAPNMETRT